MANWFCTDPKIGVQSLTETSTTQKMALGSIIRAYDDATSGYGTAEFIYLLGIAGTIVGDLVLYNQVTFATTITPNTANLAAPVAVAMSANVASQYGWYQISGIATIKKTAVKVSPNVALFQSGTTGRVMSTVASGKQLLGARSANAATVLSATSTIDAVLDRPHLQGQAI